MSRDDWFRRKSWSKKDEAAFFERWSRSRSDSQKAQYLRIQALELAAAGDASLTRAALGLVDRHFSEFTDPYGDMHAHAIAASCFETLGETEEAIKHHRLALQARERAPHQDVGTELHYPWLIVSRGLSQLYDEALDVLARAHLAFPVQLFKAAAIRALIADSKGNKSDAARYATEALQAAALQTSEFRHHRNVGLVDEGHAAVVKKLQSLTS